QNRIVACRLEIFQRELKNRVQPCARMQHVEIERSQLVPEVQFRIVVERPADVRAQLLFNCPADHVAHCVKIKVKIECNIVIETETLIVNRVATNQTKTEGNDSAVNSPNEKARVFRRLFRDPEKKFPTQIFKFHRRSLMDLEIERINRVHIRR